MPAELSGDTTANECSLLGTPQSGALGILNCCHDAGIGDDREGALVQAHGIRGVWQSQAVALFQVHVTHTGAQSYTMLHRYF